MRFLADRRGTAEVIGSILFIIILMFLFVNVYLWHDAAVKNADSMNVKQMNAGMTLNWDETNGLTLTAERSDVSLYRIWLVYDGKHYHTELTDVTAYAKKPLPIMLQDYLFTNDYESLIVSFGDLESGDRLTVINTLGVKAELVK
jgi:hypothetical protein